MPIRMYNGFCRKERKGRKEMELNEFNRRQHIESDFDRQIKLLLDGDNV